MTSSGMVLLDVLRSQPVSMTVRGNDLREIRLESSRYVIDGSGLLSRGWQQYDTDQDAAYFGVWVCRETLETLTYAEGDWQLVKCPGGQAFSSELASMAEYYGPPPPALVAIDVDGSVTHYFDARPQ